MTRNSLIIIAFLLFIGVVRSVHAGELDPAALARILTGMPNHEARFHEERRMQLLEKPLLLEGRLKFVAPDHIEKHTTAPGREELIVDGDWVSLRLFERKNDRRFRISDDPVLQALFVTLLAILNGEPEKLNSLYRVQAQGSANAWSLHLEPATEPLADRVESVDVSGQDNRLHRIEVRETTGDFMFMTVEYQSGG